jgi:hypothetical protein
MNAINNYLFQYITL